VRTSVIGLLGKHQTLEISATLAGLQGDHTPAVRIALARALAQFESPVGDEALLALALDDNPLVRDPALEGLAAFNNASLTQTMLRYLGDKASRRRRRAAVAYLSHSGATVPPATLLPLVHDKDPGVRLDTVQALLRMPGAGVKIQLVYLLDDPQKDVRLALLSKLEALLKLPGVNKRVVDKNLAKLIKDKDAEVQALAKRQWALMHLVH
jgi:HEAT repeat protein